MKRATEIDLNRFTFEMPKIQKGDFQFLRIDLDDPISKSFSVTYNFSLSYRED